jgi:hypothetical protein
VRLILRDRYFGASGAMWSDDIAPGFIASFFMACFFIVDFFVVPVWPDAMWSEDIASDFIPASSAIAALANMMPVTARQPAAILNSFKFEVIGKILPS